MQGSQTYFWGFSHFDSVDDVSGFCCCSNIGDKDGNGDEGEVDKKLEWIILHWNALTIIYFSHSTNCGSTSVE